MVLVALMGTVQPAAAANREPFAAAQWGLRQVGADAAWEVTRGAGARVGMVDTGIDYAHSELAGRIVGSTRCIGTGGQVARCGGTAEDDSGHGTHVAGIMAAALDGVGIAGVAPEASLLVVKALQADGSGEAYDVASGIDWLVSQGVNVVNLSLAETISADRVKGSPVEAAIRRAADAGVVVVLAAGNQGGTSEARSSFDLPAIVVGATDRDGRLARYSQPLATSVRWGLVAPGGDGSGGTEAEVVSTYWFAGRRNAYAWSEGTSMAAPHVSGAAALLAAQGIRGRAAIDRLLATAAPFGCGPGCRGLLDVGSALGAAARPSPQPPSNSTVSAQGSAPKDPATTAATAASPPASAASPSEPGPASSTTQANGADAAMDSWLAQIAVAPPPRSVALEPPATRRGRDLRSRAGMAAVGAALVLLAVAAVGLARSWRRLRADAEW